MTQTDGRMVIISTPKGRNWFYDEYQKGEKSFLLPGDEDPNPEWLSIRMPTWSNPYVKPQRILTMRKNMPSDVFEQEIAARFMLESAGVFRGIDGCIRKGLVDHLGRPINETPISGQRYVMGVDLARKRDYTVITVIDALRHHVVYHERFNSMSWAIQKARIIEVSRLYNRARVVMDGTGLGDPIVEDVKSAGVPVECFIFGTRSKQELIEKLRTDIEFQRITFPYIPVMIRELRAFEYEINSNGHIKYNAPPGQHDDCVASLALAVHGMNKRPSIIRCAQVRGA
jgi:phage FluMu gp28-like protein